MFHLVSLSLQISLTVCLARALACVCVLLVLLFLLGWLLVSFFWGNLISITGSFQLLTDHVSHLSGNAGKKNLHLLDLTFTPPPFTPPQPSLTLRTVHLGPSRVLILASLIHPSSNSHPSSTPTALGRPSRAVWSENMFLYRIPHTILGLAITTHTLWPSAVPS